MKIGALIITYNPDLIVLEKNFEAIKDQVNKVVIVDNGSNNFNKILNVISKEVKIIKNDKNMGIAFALNQGMEFFKKNGYSWVITLDQDSILSENSVKKMMKYSSKNVGILCPRIKYLGQPNKKIKINTMLEEIDACMTSASLTNIEAWEKSGKFSNELFIDYVDNDFCMKLKLNNYSIIRVNECVLEHNLGETCNITFFYKKFYYSRHSAIRCYYIIRNIIIFNNKYRKNINYFKETIKVFYLFLINLLFCTPRFKVLYYSLKGFWHGVIGKNGVYE